MTAQVQKAKVIPTGVFPVGGTVNGVCQMKHHESKKNRLKQDQEVTVTNMTIASVTTWGKFYDESPLQVVRVEGVEGWYPASAFKFH